jgi:transcriptional regulator
MALFYNPAHFRVQDTAALSDFIRQYPLATFITHGAHGISVSHLPMILADVGGRMLLRGHIARANEHWKAVRDSAEALAIFHGPQAYVTPQWYPSKLKDARVVPTWNYAVTHVRGTVRAIEDKAWLRELVDALTRTHEQAFAHQWQVTDAPEAYIDKMLGAIVGLEIEVTHIEGKWKLSQNRTDADYSGTKNGLAARGETNSDAVNAMMAER